MVQPVFHVSGSTEVSESFSGSRTDSLGKSRAVGKVMTLSYCIGEKVANEGISHYDLDNFCINKPLRKPWLPPSMEGGHHLQLLCYGLP